MKTQSTEKSLVACYVYTLPQAAVVLNRSVKYLRKIIALGRLRASRDSAGYLITGSAIEEYIKSTLVK